MAEGGLRTDLLDDFGKKLDQIYVKLEQLDTQLQKFEKRTVSIELTKETKGAARALDELARAFDRFLLTQGQTVTRAANNLTKFVNLAVPALEQLEKVNVSRIGSTLSSLTQIFSTFGEQDFDAVKRAGVNVLDFTDLLLLSLDRLNKVDDIRKPLSTLNSLSDFFKKFANIDLDQVKLFAVNVQDVVDVLSISLKNLASIPDIRKPLSTLNSITTAFSKFSGLNNSGILATIDSLKLFGDGIIIALDRIGQGIDDEQVKVIASSVRSFTSLFKTFETLGKGSGNTAKSVESFNKIFSAIRQTLEGLGRLSALIQAEKGAPLKALSSFIANIQKAVAAFTTLGSAFQRKNVFNVFDRPLERAIGLFKRIIVALREAIESFKGDSGSLDGLAKFIRRLPTLVDVFINLQNKFRQLGSLTRSQNLFGRILKSLTNSVKDFKADPGSLDALTNFIEKLPAVVDIFIKLQNEFNKLFSLQKSAGRFGKIVQTIVKSINKIKIPKNTNFESFAAIFNSIIEIAKELTGSKTGLLDTAANNAPKAYLFTTTLSRLVDPIAKVTKSLKGVKDGAFVGLDSLIRTLVNLDFSRFDESNVQGVKALAAMLKELSKGLKGVKFDDKSLKALSALGKFEFEEGDSPFDSLSKNMKDVGQDTTALGGRFEDLSDEISEGIVEGTLKVSILEKAFTGLRFVAEQVFNVFQQFGTLSLFRNALEGAAALGDSIKEIGDNVRDAGENLRDIGTGLIDSFGIGTITGSETFGQAVDFDRISTQLEVFGGLNEEALAEAQEFANVIGKDYPLSANDALSAILDLTKAGLDLNEVEFTLPAAADLAALSDSGDIQATTNTLIAAASGFTVFGERSGELVGGFENINVAADIISGAADISTASVESLSEGLANVGPAANAFGLSLEETAAVLAIFDQNAVSGAEGGTALRSLLNALGSDKSIETLNSLGIALFDPDTGARRPLNDIINDIGASLEDLPEAQRAGILQNLADTFGRQGLNILLNAGSDAIANTVDAIGAVPPASERAAAMLDNFAGDVEQLQGSMETLLVRALLPTLDRFFRPFIKVARFVVDGFLQLDDAVLTFISSALVISSLMATIIGGFLVFVGVVLQVGGALFIVIGTLLNFGAVIAGIAVGITAFVAGLATIVLVGTAVLPIILGITAVFETLFKIFKEDAGGAATAAQNFFTGILDSIKVFTDFIGSLVRIVQVNAGLFSGSGRSGIGGIGAAIAQFFRGITDPITNFLNTGIGDKLRQVTNIFNTIAQVTDLGRQLGSIRTAIAGGGLGTEQLDAFISQIADIEGQISDLLFGLSNASPLVRDALQRIFGPIRDVGDLSDALGLFVDQFNEHIREIASAFGAMTGIFQTFFSSLFSGTSFSDAFATLLADFDSTAGDFVRSIIDFIAFIFGPSRFVQQLNLIFRGSLSDSVGRIIPLIVDTIRDAVISNRDTLKNVVTTLFSFFFAPLKSLRFFADLLGIEPLVRLIDFFEGIIRNLVGGLFDTVINVLEGQSIGDALVNAFGEGIQPLVNLGEAIFNAIGLIADAVGLLFGSFDVPGGNPIDGFIDFISSRVDSLANTINTISTLILEPLSRGDFGAILSNIGGVIVEKLSQVGQFIKDALGSINIDFTGIGITILNNLISGISTAFTNLTELTGIDFSNVTSLLTTTLEANVALLSTGPDGIFAGVANTILGVLMATITGVFSTITTFTGIDFSSVSTGLMSLLDTTLDANLAAAQAGGVGGAFSITANTIVGLLGAAIDTALLGLADLIGIDTTSIQNTLDTAFAGVFTSIQNLFQDTEGGDSVFTNIKQTIDNIVLAFTTLFDFFTNNAAPDSSGAGGLLQVLGDFIGRLIGFGVDTMTSIFDAVDVFFEELSNLDPAQLTSLAVAITAGALAFFIFSGSLTTFVAAAAPVVASIAGFAAAALILKAVATNISEVFDVIDRLLRGDILGAAAELFDALVNIFADIAFTIAGLLGFDTLFGSTEEDVVEMARSLGGQIGQIFDLLGQKLSDFVSIGIANLQLLAAHAKAATAGIFSDADENFEAVNTFFQETRDFSLESLGQIKNAEVDAGVVANFALVNQDEISNQVREEISANIAAGVNGIDADQVQTLIDVGALDRVLSDAIASGDTDIVSAIFASGNTNIAPEQIQASIDQVLAAIESGLLGREEGIDMLSLLGFDTTTLEPVTVDVPVDVQTTTAEGEPVLNEAQQEIERLRQEAQTAADAAAASAPPVTTEVTTVTDVVPAETPEEMLANVTAEAEAQAATIQEQVAATQQTIATELGVETTTTSLGLENVAPETLPQFAVDVAALQTNLGLLKTDIDTTIPVLQTVVTEFAAFNDALVLVDTQLILTNTNIQLITTSLTQLGLAAAFHLQLVLLPALDGIIAKGVALGVGFPVYITAATTAMSTFAATAQSAFGAIATGTAAAISNVQKLTKALVDADAAARSVDSAVTNATGGGGGTSAAQQAGGEGNAGGGSFKEGDVKQIDEGGSEVLIENGKMYLVARNPGKVQTLEQSGLAEIGRSRNAGIIPKASNQTTYQTSTSNTNVVVEGSQLSVAINGTNLSASEITRQVIPQVQAFLDQRDSNIAAKLRTKAR